MRTIATLIVCVMSLSVAWGQSQAFSQIQGTVQDASGAPVPGAQIKATQTDTGVSREQDLSAFELSRRVFAPAEHRRKLRAFGLVQFHPIPYVHGWSPAIEGNDESRGR